MTLTQTLLSITVAGTLFCSSCISRAYYYSPLVGNNATYHSIPLASDSVRASTYANAAISLGGMNELLRDGVYTLQAGIHRAHVVDNFRMYYGGSFTAGSYHISPYTFDENTYIDTSLMNRKKGSRFFGAYGLAAGISATNHVHRGEWRYLGIEGSLSREFGSYYNFRKGLPDSAATEIDRKNYLGSLALTTEIITKSRHQHEFGVKLALGSYLRKLNYTDNYPSYYDDKPYDNLFFFTNTYHFTNKKTTVYFQYTIATHAAHFQVGYNYRF